MFRQLHRWTSLPLILFLFLLVATGVVLQFEEIGKLGGEESAPPAAATANAGNYPSDRAIQAQLNEALASARQAGPDFRPQRIELTVTQGRETTRLAQQPRGGPFIQVNHATGEVAAEMNPELPLHVLLIQLHTGAAMGAFGVWVMLVASLILLWLSISGAYLYWQMWRNRAARGRKRLFWK